MKCQTPTCQPDTLSTQPYIVYAVRDRLRSIPHLALYLPHAFILRSQESQVDVLLLLFHGSDVDMVDVSWYVEIYVFSSHGYFMCQHSDNLRVKEGALCTGHIKHSISPSPDVTFQLETSMSKDSPDRQES
jgi:hypothetical protein